MKNQQELKEVIQSELDRSAFWMEIALKEKQMGSLDSNKKKLFLKELRNMKKDIGDTINEYLQEIQRVIDLL